VGENKKYYSTNINKADTHPKTDLHVIDLQQISLETRPENVLVKSWLFH
jgi:hypothetical protein